MASGRAAARPWGASVRAPQSATPADGPAVLVDQEKRHPNSAASTDIRKGWLNVQAKCLMAGFPASLIDDDAGKSLLVVSRWALTRSFSSVAEAETWLARVGGAT
jgi:hypothetical protein